MKTIKNYKQFLEAVSGTLAPVRGPGYPEMELRPTISQMDTNVVFDDGTDKIYSEDEYDELYRNYLQNGGVPLMGGLNKENLEKILSFKK